MSKNQKASGITNIINYDNSGNISFVSGSTTLMSVSSSGAVVLTGTMSGGTADSASLSANSNLLQGTGSIGFATTASLLEVSSSQQQISSSLLQVSASYIALSASYNVFSGSASTRVTQIESTYATTGSNSFRANQSITGSLVVSSTITAQTLVVQTVTSSIVYSSGSNLFGSALGDRQTFTGSVNITGSLTVNTTGTEFQVNNNGVVMGNLLTDTHSVTGSLSVTGSQYIFGNFGIGTTSPASKLSIGGIDNQASVLTYTPSLTRQSFFNTYYSNSETLFPQYLDIVSYGQPDGTNGGSVIRFLTNPVTNASAAIERMRITSAGVLLINNNYASPTGVLNTYKTPVSSNFVDQIVVQSTGNYPSLRLGTYDAYDAVIATTGNDLRILAGLNVTTENHDIRFYTSFNGGTGGAQNYERMRIAYTGYVGIGASSPATTLHVAGPIGGGLLVAGAYPQNVRHAKAGSTSVTFTITVPFIGAWYAGQALIKCAGAQNGLQEQYAAMYFVRLTYYGGGGVSSVVNNVSGDTSNASVTVSGTAGSNPQVITITVSDVGASTNTFVADIDATFMGGVISIS